MTPRPEDHHFTKPKTACPTDRAGPSRISVTTVHGRTVAFIGAPTGTRRWRVTLDGHKVAHKRAYAGQPVRVRATAVSRGFPSCTTSNPDGRATPRAGDDNLFRVRIG